MNKKNIQKNSHKVSGPLKKIITGTTWFGNKTLNGIERVGNKLPQPFFLFIYLTIIVMIIGLILHFAIPKGVEINVYQPKEGKIVLKQVNFFNFFSSDGIVWLLKNFIDNFLGLQTIGVVLITGIFAMVAEKSGFFDVGLKKIAHSLPKKALTPILIMFGTISSIVSDAGYLILIPLSGVLYHKVGRHPVIGVVAMFAGVSAGFAANLVPSVSDFILVTSTNNFLDKEVVNPLSNIYFTILLIGVYTLTGWFVTEKIVAKRIEKNYFVDKKHDAEVDKFKLMHEKYRLKSNEKRAMWWVLGFTIIYLLGIALMIVIPNAPFNSLINSNLQPTNQDVNLKVEDYNILRHMILLISFLFLGIGIVYGFISGNFKNRNDFINSLIFGFKRVVPSLLVFIIMAQFIAILKITNIDTVVAYFIGQGLKNLSPFLIILLFIVIVSIINLFIGGLSSKWFILGPIFVIALNNANIHPAATIMAYRIGDSATNIISPIMVYFPMVLGFAHEWLSPKSKNQFQTGSLLSLMMPYSILFLLSSTLVFLIWFILGIPLGVGGPIFGNVLQENTILFNNLKDFNLINFNHETSWKFYLKSSFTTF